MVKQHSKAIRKQLASSQILLSLPFALNLVLIMLLDHSIRRDPELNKRSYHTGGKESLVWKLCAIITEAEPPTTICRCYHTFTPSANFDGAYSSSLVENLVVSHGIGVSAKILTRV